MNKENKRLYEGMYILSATLSDEARKKAFSNIQSQITERGGEIKKIHEWGRKKLAFEVNGHREGYYFILYFDATPATINELWREYHLNEDLVRFMTMTADAVMEEIKFKSLVEQV